MNHRWLSSIASAAALVAVTSTLVAQLPPDEMIDARAEALLREAARVHGGANAMEFKARVTVTDGQGRPAPAPMEIEAIVQRPNRIASHISSNDRVVAETISNDDGVHILYPQRKSYIRRQRIASFEELAADDRLARSTQTVYFTLILAPDIRHHLLNGAQRLEYLGSTTVDGRTLEGARVVRPTGTLDLWIQGKGTRTIQRIVDTSRGDGTTAPSTTTVDFAEVHLQPELDAKTFAFEPGSAYHEATGLGDAIRRTSASDTERKQATPFKLPLLGGGSLDLAAHRGRNVVVLDFWATWCAPCRESLPVLDEVAKEFDGQDVAFYAVNLGDDTEKVQRFAADTALSLPIALDQQGEVRRAYRVFSIPTLVIIDKDGYIHSRKMGLSPELAADLRADIASARAGQ